MAGDFNISQQLAKLYQQERGKVLATLVRLFRDFDLAEEAMHDAFTDGIEQWVSQGIPANPTAWLISTGRFKAIDAIRRKSRFGQLQATDLNHAIALMSVHPGVKAGPFELRPADESVNQLIAARAQQFEQKRQ